MIANFLAWLINWFIQHVYTLHTIYNTLHSTHTRTTQSNIHTTHLLNLCELYSKYTNWNHVCQVHNPLIQIYVTVRAGRANSIYRLVINQGKIVTDPPNYPLRTWNLINCFNAVLMMFYFVSGLFLCTFSQLSTQRRGTKALIITFLSSFSPPRLVSRFFELVTTATFAWINTLGLKNQHLHLIKEK